MTPPAFLHPEALVSTAWLAEHLEDPDLRVFDVTNQLVYGVGNGKPYDVASGRPDFEAGHIPGSGYLDLAADFSVADSPYHFTLPRPEVAAAAFARHGITDGTRSVFYSRGRIQLATRFWWMLRWLGVDSASVLDGGYHKWTAEGRPVSTAPCAYPAGKLTISPRPGLFVGRNDVVAALGRSDRRLLNALGPDLHSGRDPRYGRPGRIPGSVNVPASGLLDPKTMEVLPPPQVAAAFAAQGIVPQTPTIAYCGGGIAATLSAFLLYQLGHPDVAVYDSSMSEWASDPSLPIETD